MGVHSSEDLLAHVGHKVSVVTYGERGENAANVAAECEDCNLVLIDFDCGDHSSPNPDGEGGYGDAPWPRTVQISEQVGEYLSELIEYQMDHGSGIEDPDDQAAFDALVQFLTESLL